METTKDDETVELGYSRQRLIHDCQILLHTFILIARVQMSHADQNSL